MRRVVERLRLAAARAALAEVPDDQLLRRFTGGDESAFAELVRRHGPMVRGVCRRRLRDEADVDDAVQATFLVLLRKAGSVDRPGLLGNWLFGVALRTACDLRARNRRRRQAPLADRPAEPPPAADLEPLLDEELGRLPEMYRAPLVLCHLQGLSRRQ